MVILANDFFECCNKTPLYRTFPSISKLIKVTSLANKLETDRENNQNFAKKCKIIPKIQKIQIHFISKLMF